jgi:alkylation response protein AidB-like acyl-CoA dehydrogenase
MDATQTVSYMNALEKVATDVIRPAAAEIDQNGAFPRAAMDALSRSGLLGLISSKEVGGMGEGLRAAAMVIERVAQECASTAMVLCMHYAGTAVIEAHGPLAIRKAIAEGKHVTTLAFSEQGRSHFCAGQHSCPSQWHRSFGCHQELGDFGGRGR